MTEPACAGRNRGLWIVTSVGLGIGLTSLGLGLIADVAVHHGAGFSADVSARLVAFGLLVLMVSFPVRSAFLATRFWHEGHPRLSLFAMASVTLFIVGCAIRYWLP